MSLDLIRQGKNAGKITVSSCSLFSSLPSLTTSLLFRSCFPARISQWLLTQTFSPCVWELSRDTVKTSLTLQKIAQPSLSTAQRQLLGQNWGKSMNPESSLSSPGSRSSSRVRSREERAGASPPTFPRHSIFPLNSFKLGEPQVSAWQSKKARPISTLKKLLFLCPIYKNTGIFFGNFPSWD